MSILDSENAEFRVVVNPEGQYSIWPTSHETPAGWDEVDKIGKKHECLEYIEREWKDMRPRSLRQKVDADRGDRKG